MPESLSGMKTNLLIFRGYTERLPGIERCWSSLFCYLDRFFGNLELARLKSVILLPGSEDFCSSELNHPNDQIFRQSFVQGQLNRTFSLLVVL